MKRFRILPVLLLAVTLSVGCSDSFADHDHVVTRAEPDYSAWPGQSVDIFGARFVDVNGQVHQLGVDEEIRPIVLVFIDRDCTVSSRYAPELNDFYHEAKNSDVQFYGVVSESLMSASEANSFVREFGFEFPVIWDSFGDLAKRVQPYNTPEAFVISPNNEVLYRGRIDNRFANILELRRHVTAHDLRDVLNSIKNNQQFTPYRTASVGCIFEAWSHRDLPDEVTYTRHVQPMINANCVECHREGSVAPFPLQTYEQTRRRAEMVSLVTSHRIMPPWPAKKGVGLFRNERHLSARQIRLLSTWVEQGVTYGNDEDTLPDPVWPARDWLMGEPDLVIEMAESYRIPAGGDDIYRYFVIPVDIVEDRHIVGFEFRPGDARAVHHSLVYLDYTGRARAMDSNDDEYGFSVFGTGGFMDASDPERAVYVGGWAPGIDPLKLPPGHGIPLKGKSGDAVFEIHYRPIGKSTSDRSRIGLYFAKNPVSKIVASTVAGTVDVDISPENDSYWRQVYMDIPAHIKLIGVSPHMHYIGKEVKAVATLPDQTRVPLIDIPDWNFRWQNVYMYRQPIELPAGSRIDAWFKFDNSSANPSNPHNPAKRITWGWSSDQEMSELWMRFVAETQEDRELVQRAGNRSWSRDAEPTELPPD